MGKLKQMERKRLPSDLHRELLRRFLLSWHDSINYQTRLLKELAFTLEVEPDGIFYHWVKPPHCSPYGFIRDTTWSYVFHGFADCDLKNEVDGRFLQVSFGPRGRYDVFSAWGTLQYVMASKLPWPEYPLLKRYFANQPPPYNHLSGSYNRMQRLVEPLKNLGLLEVVDRKLLEQKIDLSNRYTRIYPDGRRIYEPPDPFNDPEQEIFWDLEVAHAQKLTPLGSALLKSGLDEEAFADLWSAHGLDNPKGAIKIYPL